MKMRKTLTALVALALCVGVVGAAYAQVGHPVTVIKQGRWVTWGPNGSVGSPKDTTNLDGAVQDTTEAIDISDMNFSAGGLATGPGATTPVVAIRVFLTSDGPADNVDSVYFRVECSPDGIHWNVPLAANNLNTMSGAIAGADQGNAATGTSVNNLLTYTVKVDQDVVDGAPVTGVINASWGFAKFIRVVHRNMASDVFQKAKLFVAYPGYRESH